MPQNVAHSRWFDVMAFHRRLLVVLLSFDILLILTSGVLRVATVGDFIPTTPAFLNIGNDWSAGEILNYLKWTLMIAVFLFAWHVTGLRLYAALAFFACLVLSDDALQLHERGSEMLMSVFPDLRRDNGSATEIVIWIMIGLLGVSAVWTGLRGAPNSELEKVRMVGLLFVPIIFFGVVVDAMHAVAESQGHHKASWILLLVEDGGEMLAISVLAAHVVASFRPQAR